MFNYHLIHAMAWNICEETGDKWWEFLTSTWGLKHLGYRCHCCFLVTFVPIGSVWYGECRIVNLWIPPSTWATEELSKWNSVFGRFNPQLIRTWWWMMMEDGWRMRMNDDDDDDDDWKLLFHIMMTCFCQSECASIASEKQTKELSPQGTTPIYALSPMMSAPTAQAVVSPTVMPMAPVAQAVATPTAQAVAAPAVMPMAPVAQAVATPTAQAAAAPAVMPMAPVAQAVATPTAQVAAAPAVMPMAPVAQAVATPTAQTVAAPSYAGHLQQPQVTGCVVTSYLGPSNFKASRFALGGCQLEDAVSDQNCLGLMWFYGTGDGSYGDGHRSGCNDGSLCCGSRPSSCWLQREVWSSLSQKGTKGTNTETQTGI